MPTPEPEKRVKRPRLRLPFEKRKQDAGSWTYDHRIGLCVTLIAYLVLMIAFVSSKIDSSAASPIPGWYIDLQTLAELEQERDRLERLARRTAGERPDRLAEHPEPGFERKRAERKAQGRPRYQCRGAQRCRSCGRGAHACNREAYEQGLAEERAIRQRRGAGRIPSTRIARSRGASRFPFR